METVPRHDIESDRVFVTVGEGETVFLVKLLLHINPGTDDKIYDRPTGILRNEQIANFASPPHPVVPLD